MSLWRRTIQQDIDNYLKSNETKILFIWGPRRSGKTTLLDDLSKKLGVEKYNFDLISHREKFIPDLKTLGKIVQDNKVILIDEVQNYPAGTLALKVLFDHFKIKIIATGSSELRQKTGVGFDSLAGRYKEIYCLPYSVVEVRENQKPKVSDEKQFEKELAKQAQIFGLYPEIYSKSLSEQEKIDILEVILESYIIKDVANIYELKDQKLALDILKKIALQLGSESSIREIADSLGANQSTVASYIEIFVKNYVLISLPSFKTNIRKAVSENRKLFFYDLGIRNILVRDFRDLELRPDRGGVFENFIISELEKAHRVFNTKVNMYFYREYGGKEVDLIIEDYKKNYIAVEIKANKGVINDIFPIPHKKDLITEVNYFEKIEKLINTNFKGA